MSFADGAAERVGDPDRLRLLVRAADPRGDAVHLALACVFLALLCISTALGSIALVPLAVFALVRTPRLWRLWAWALAYPPVAVLAAFLGWSLLALLWSPDLDNGREMLRGARTLLVPFALYPVADRWRPLLAAFLAGTSAQALAQLLQLGGVLAIDPDNPIRHAGFFSHPGYLTLFHAIGLVLGFSWFLHAQSRRARLLIAGAALLSIVGIGIAAGRGAMLGLLAGGAIAVVLELRRRLPTGRAMLATLLVVGAAAAAVASVPLVVGGEGLERKLKDFETIGDHSSTDGRRVLHLRAALGGVAEHPFVGAGTGGTRDVMLHSELIRDAAAARPDLGLDYFVTVHPHSVYVQVLLEQGAIGLALLLAGLALAAHQALRMLRAPVPPAPAIAAGIAGALVIWAVAAGFDAFHASSRTAAIGWSVLTLSLCGPPPRWFGAAIVERITGRGAGRGAASGAGSGGAQGD